MGIPQGLDDRSRSLLDFERDWVAYQDGKARAIRTRFAISAARYYQLLASAIDSPEAEAYDPLTVRRLRRRRDERRRHSRGDVGRVSRH